MAKAYQKKDAENVLASLNRISRKFTEVVRLQEKKRADIRQVTDKLLESHAFANTAVYQLRGGSVSSSSYNDDFIRLIEHLNALKNVQQLFVTIQEMEKMLNAVTQQYYAPLERCSGGLKRIFSTSKSKEAADTAYEKIDSFLKSSFSEDLDRMIKDVEKDVESADGNALYSFDVDPSPYKRILRAEYPEAWTRANIVQLVSDITSAYTELNEKLCSILEPFDREMESVSVLSAQLWKKGIFDQYMYNDLYGRSYVDHDVLNPLIESLSQCLQTAKACPKLNAVEAELNESLRRDLPVVSSVEKDIDWVFSSAESRKKVSAAYRRLFSKKEYFASLIKSCQEASSQNDIDEDAFFEKNIHEIGKLLHSINPALFGSSALPKFILRLTSGTEELVGMVNGKIPEIDKQKNQVIGWAKQLIRIKTIKMLESVPAEELNRYKEGFKIKTLRDNGYYTIADIVRGNIYQMCGIYGISAYVINEIKHAAEQIEMEAEKAQKIHLSLDDRNNESDHLVCSIFAYKKSKKTLLQMQEEWKKIEHDITDSLQTITGIKNSLEYFFFNSGEKEAYLRAFRKLSDALSSSETGLIEDMSVALNSPPVQVTVDETWADFEKDPVAYINILEELVPEYMGNDDSVYGLPEYLAKEIQDQCFFPDGLLCTLRPYQEWGVKYILHQEKVLLGDEMGLGKTVQAIASMVSLRNTGATHFIVICPASVVVNWCHEITKKSKLRAYMYYGKAEARRIAYLDWTRSDGVLVVSYENAGNVMVYKEKPVSMLVVDEAHYVKNVNAQRTQAIKSLAQYSDRLLFMTGTALENRVSEMVALINMLQPPVARSIQDISFLVDAPLFRERVAPVYYRRKREQVLTELPQLIESTEWCTLGSVEESVYEKNVCEKSYAEARRVSWIMNDLSLSCKAQRMKELVEEAAEDNRKIIVFSFFLDTIDKVCRLFGSRCTAPITGSTSSIQRQQIIDEFEKAGSGTILPAQIQSGGTGLNIQAASVVIICEPQLKPSIENQAISRAYRMGQTRSVLVYRLLCSNTVDERIQELLDEKRQVFNAFADKSVAGDESLESMELDNSTFGDIIKAEIERIKSKTEGSSSVSTDTE